MSDKGMNVNAKAARDLLMSLHEVTTQEQLAERVGRSTATVSNWFNGRKGSQRTLIRLFEPFAVALVSLRGRSHLVDFTGKDEVLIRVTKDGVVELVE